MKRKNTLTSAISPLTPIRITDATTGEQLPISILHSSLHALISAVRDTTQEYWEEHESTLVEQFSTYTGKPSPAEYGRQAGITPVLSLPREVKAQSRIMRLVRHKLVSEGSAYSLNPNPLKQSPSFPLTINLGAVDKQMASLSYENGTLGLLFKCWDREYYLEFVLPSYILEERSPMKFTLPSVIMSKGEYRFVFAYVESTPILKGNELKAGVDLGRVKPYVVAITNQNGARVAHYESSPRLTKLNQKRERLLNEKKHTHAKLSAYINLNTRIPQQEVLSGNLDALGSKIKRLGKALAQETGNELATKLHKHGLNLVHVEDLRWATGSKYGSKWSHSIQQAAITHSLTRQGTRVKRVNPRNSSRSCHACGTILTHSGRSVRCSECQVSFDRDYNAAMNLATLRHLNTPYPVMIKRLNGANSRATPTGSVQVSEPPVHESQHENPILVTSLTT